MGLSDLIPGSMTGKVVIGLIIVSVLGFLAWDFTHLQDKNEAAQKTIGKQEVIIGVQKQNAEDTAKSNENTNTHVASAVANQQSADQKQQQIQTHVDTKVQQIKQKFDQLPKTPENTASESDAISNVRIKGYWESYCAAASDPACKDNQ